MATDHRQRMIEKARALHGPDRFVYDPRITIWGSSKAPLKVLCRSHGKFWTKPNIHRTTTHGGCPGCKERERICAELDAEIVVLAKKLRDKRKERRDIEPAYFAAKLAKAGICADYHVQNEYRRQ